MRYFYNKKINIEGEKTLEDGPPTFTVWEIQYCEMAILL